MKRIIAICFAILGTLSAAQASERYVIRSMTFEIEGRTRQYFIEKLVERKVGDEFPDREALDAFLKDSRQILLNERVLELAEVLPAFGEPVLQESGGEEKVYLVPVDILVRTKDTWNLIGLPYFRYDSNNGLLLALRGRDYNFFGTMQPLILNVNWDFDTDGTQTPEVEAKFKFPFRAAEIDWAWDFDTAFSLPDWSEIDFYLDTGIAAELPLGGHTLTLYASQRLDVGAEDSAGVPYDDPYYFTSYLGAYYTWKVLQTKSYGNLTIQPKVNLAYRWKPEGLDDAGLAATPALTPGITASIGRVNWVGNFRKGAKATATVSYPIDLSDGSAYVFLSGNASGFLNYGFVGPSARLSGFARINGSEDTSAGDPIRGVLDSRIKTTTALFLNLDLPFRVIRFLPATWFKKSWMRSFHFEQHWSPFLDLALVETDDGLFLPKDAWVGAGLAVITYPAISRSFFVRISVGWDLRDVLELKALSGTSLRDGAGIRELFFGVGHHY